MLREFTKAVLRDMPEDVLAYSKDYFVEKAAAKRMESYSLPASTSKPFGELSPVLQQQIEDVFKRYDIDCDMSISIDELRTLMSDLGGAYIPKPVFFSFLSRRQHRLSTRRERARSLSFEGVSLHGHSSDDYEPPWCLFSTPRPSGRGLLGAEWPTEAATRTRLPGFSSAE